MGLLVTNNRDAVPYLDLVGGSLRRIVPSNTAIQASYLDRDDRIIGHTHVGNPGSSFSTILDPNLIDSASSRIGDFASPISGGDGPTVPYFVSDFEPATNDQQLYQPDAVSGFRFTRLSYNDPTQIEAVDPYPNLDQTGSNVFPNGTEGGFQAVQDAGQWVFFPGIDLAIGVTHRVWTSGPTAQNDVVSAVTLSTGFAQPLNLAGPVPLSPSGGNAIGRYATGTSQFNRGAIFGESVVTFKGIQFLPDDTSTHAQPRGELFLWSAMTDPDGAGGVGRIYVQFVDFNPFNLPAVEGVTPSRVHLRQTLLSRVVVAESTRPVGDPPVPLNGWIQPASGSSLPSAFFTTFGSRRLHFVNSEFPTPFETWLLQVSKGAIPAIISVPSPKGQVLTNRQVTYQAEVTGDLSEAINGAVVTWTIGRGSTQAEVLATTPSLGETVVVENFPIDRDVAFPPGFAVLKDAVEMTEGAGAGEYQVVEATGSITFGAAEPVAGPVYRCRYAHPAAPALPAHGTVVDPSVFTTVLGIAQTRVTYPDDDTLAGHIDVVTASTPT